MNLIQTFETDASLAIATVEKLGAGWFVPFRTALYADAHALLTAVIGAETPAAQVAIAGAGTAAFLAAESTAGDLSAKIAAAEAAFTSSIEASGQQIAANTVAVAFAAIKADLLVPAPAPAS